MAAMMVMAVGVTAFAAENNTEGYTSAQVYYEGEPAPMGMDTGCFESISTDENGATVIKLKSFGLGDAVGYIDACETMDGTELVSDDNSTLTIPASLGSSVDVKITFGGLLASLIEWGIVPMDNPMSCTIVLS